MTIPLLEAWAANEETFERVRGYKRLAEMIPPRPAVGHMPFPGHRDQLTVLNARRSAREFGFEG